VSPRSARILRAAAERRATKLAEMRARSKVVAIQAGDLSNVVHQQAHTYRATLPPGTNVAIYALDARSNKHVWWARLQGFDENLNARLLWWEQDMNGTWRSTYEETLPPTALLGVADPGHAPRTYLWMLPVANQQQDRQVHGRALALSERIRREQEYQEEREAQLQAHLEAQEAQAKADLVARRHISFLQNAQPFLSARDCGGAPRGGVPRVGSLGLLPFRGGDSFPPLFLPIFFFHLPPSSGRADSDEVLDEVLDEAEDEAEDKAEVKAEDAQHLVKKEEIGGI